MGESFENLEVWKRSTNLSANIYKTLSVLKDWGFRDQISRSGLSVPSNIAEGFERESNKEFINFLSYAKGSAGELRTQIYIGMEVGYIEKSVGQIWLNDCQNISKMLSGMIKARKSFNK